MIFPSRSILAGICVTSRTVLGGAVNGLPAIKVIVVTCEAIGIFTTCHPWLRLSAVVESGQSAPYPEANSARSSLRPR